MAAISRTPCKLCSDRAVQFLVQAWQTGEPFFAFASFHSPKQLITPPVQSWDMHDPA